MTATQDKSASLQQILAGGKGHGPRGYKRWLVLAAAGIVVILVYVFLIRDSKGQQPAYKTEVAETGTLVVKVSATGNLQPTNQVDVGSELSGIVEAVYVKENDRVKKGQLLVQLDLSRLQDAVTRSRANLAVAQAQLLQVQATVVEARAALERFREVARLSGGKVPSKGEMATAEATLKRAEAAEASAKASITQVQATLKTDETSLSKGYIRSPINGVVLTRTVEPGQTMAANFQAPVLFTLAEDLTKMELQVDIDEADVGQVQAGQKAMFSVDAWAGREYPATITTVGYGSQELEGVVSYPATLAVENSDLSLRPGMTATAEITTLTKDNILLIPNAALRFTPATAAGSSKKSRTIVSSLMPRPPASQAKPKAVENKSGERKVWILHDGQPMAVTVKVGASNGRQTEIVSGDLKAGMAVITESVSAGESSKP